MKRRMYIQTALCGMIIGIASCTQGELSADLQGGEGTDGALNILGASLNTGAATRANESDRTLGLADDRIGIFLQADDANSYAAIDNRLYTYATPFWQTEEQLLLNTEAAQLSAYYPYSAAYPSNPVLLRSQLYSTSADLCYTPFAASSSASLVTLRLKHAYSRMKFTLKRDASLTTAGVISRLTITGTGIRSVAQLDLFTANDGSNGNITDLPEVVAGVDLDLSAWLEDDRTISSTGAQITVDGLFIPGALTGDIGLTIAIDGVQKTGRVAATALCGSSGKLTAGKVYEVNLSVKEEKALEFNSIKVVSGWDDFNSGTAVEGDTH